MNRLKVLIKIGGRAFSDRKGFSDLAKAMGSMNADFIIVHGGGSEISEALKAAGRVTRFVDGVRVTEAEDVAIVEKVLSETVNERIAGYLTEAGCPCERMSGKTGGLVTVAPMKTRKGEALGFVGEVVGVNPAPVEAALSLKKTPVISPISADTEERTYNVNADSAAAALAAGAGCTDLIYFTDVPGVKAKEKVLERISRSEAAGLVASGDITGGMVAKLESAFAALDGGVARVHIAQWSGSLEAVLKEDGASGTTVFKSGQNDPAQNTGDLIARGNRALLGVYSRPPVVFSHGEGLYLYDTSGKAYLDFVSGIAVNALGYGDPEVIAALTEQAGKLWHCSNLFHTAPQIHLAEALVGCTFADKVFFCNSGAEAMEGAFKMARRHGLEKKGKDAYGIVAMNRSFHGRTFATLSSTGQPKLREGFGPMLEGFAFADFNDLSSVEKLLDDTVCAVVLEPIQGEGGVYPADGDFMRGVRALCDARGCLMILDEIQCGMGRTGRFCAHEHYGVTPDIMTFAKPLAGGLPLGAILTTDAVAQGMGPGSHGSTFGGGPLACRVALAIVERILQPAFLENVVCMGNYLKAALDRLRVDHPVITGIRGMGLMVGVALGRDPKPVIDACMEEGLLVCKTGENAIRLLPPLVVETRHVDEAMEKLSRALSRLSDTPG